MFHRKNTHCKSATRRHSFTIDSKIGRPSKYPNHCTVAGCNEFVKGRNIGYKHRQWLKCHDIEARLAALKVDDAIPSAHHRPADWRPFCGEEVPRYPEGAAY